MSTEKFSDKQRLNFFFNYLKKIVIELFFKGLN